MFYPLPPGMQAVPTPSSAAPLASGTPSRASTVAARSSLSASPTGATAAAAPQPPSSSGPSCFAIDSMVEHLLSYESTLVALSQVFLTGALRAGHAGPLPFLTHRFDRDGARLVPRWVQQVPHTIVQHKTPGAGVANGGHQQHQHTPLPLDNEVQVQQYTLERLVRSLHAFIADLQARLAAANPAFTAEHALELLRAEALAPTTGSASEGAGKEGVDSAMAEASSPSPSPSPAPSLSPSPSASPA